MKKIIISALVMTTCAVYAQDDPIDTNDTVTAVRTFKDWGGNIYGDTVINLEKNYWQIYVDDVNRDTGDKTPHPKSPAEFKIVGSQSLVAWQNANQEVPDTWTEVWISIKAAVKARVRLALAE